MNEMHADLARAHMSERQRQARALRRGRSVVVAQRLSRRAERAAREAGLALARS